ncbi:MAG TPA: hypothetical protein VN930_11550 [Xanthobacteraceae bacterium]|nr:hypothetical protein [Xanthobacteraceae bacterium]
MAGPSRLVFAAVAIAFGWGPAAAIESEWDGWSLHGQSTLIGQGHPRFRSLYEGQNSLTAAPQVRETWTGTLFIGRRLWEGGELFFNPELDQGFGLSKTVGLGGFANGEA